MNFAESDTLGHHGTVYPVLVRAVTEPFFYPSKWLRKTIQYVRRERKVWEWNMQEVRQIELLHKVDY